MFGSGWLLDLPIAEMLERNIKVFLNDIIHPPEVVKQVSGLKNVELIERDATGGLIEEVREKCRKTTPFSKLHTLSDIVIPELTLESDPGLDISLNIISQLDILPVTFLREKASVSEEQFMQFMINVQQKHLDFLSKHPSVMITDTTEVFTDKASNSYDYEWVVADLPEGKYKEEWTRDFDLKRSAYYQKRSVLKIVAITI